MLPLPNCKLNSVHHLLKYDREQSRADKYLLVVIIHPATSITESIILILPMLLNKLLLQ